MNLSCKEVVRLMSEGLDSGLPAEQQALLRAHYAICRGCAGMRDRMAFLRRAMRRLSGDDESG
jgi:predicted anti-sigma-YlaC factor YlaD